MSLLVLSCFKPRACCSAACFVATEKLPASRVENIPAPEAPGRPAYDVRRKSEPQSPGAWRERGCAMSEWNWAAGHMPKPLNGEMQEEHQAELREENERQDLANEATKSKRRWWKFWSRAEK
jgi:hypothetical protein